MDEAGAFMWGRILELEFKLANQKKEYGTTIWKIENTTQRAKAKIKSNCVEDVWTAEIFEGAGAYI